jgi:6-phosphogluconolactonase
MLLPATVVLTMLGILGACSSSGDGSHVAYVVGGQTSVSAFRINNGSGGVTPLPGSPYAAGRAPSSVVVHPSGQFLYVANQADSSISLFAADPTNGSLTEILPRTTGFGTSPTFVTMDSGGHFLFVANQGSNDVWAFQVGAGGLLAPVSSAPIGGAPGGLVLTPSGFLIVAVPGFSDIVVLKVGGTGLLQFVGSFPVSNGVGGVAWAPAAPQTINGIVQPPAPGFVYATNPSAGTVSVFAVQSGGALQSAPPITVAAGTTPMATAVDLSGSFLYVANTGSANVSQYKIDHTTGALTPFAAAAVTAGTNPGFVVTDPHGKFVYVGNAGAQSVTEFSINSDGSLSSTNTISPGFPPSSLAASP